jgi:hypothetical protein
MQGICMVYVWFRTQRLGKDQAYARRMPNFVEKHMSGI